MVKLRRLRAQIAANSATRTVVVCLLVLTGAAGIAAAQAVGGSGRFDLTGPKVEVRVTRGSVTLPIASVPNLQAGDRLWLHPDLPPTQSVRYLMVLAFLRGTTNPPPENWFIRIETWDKKVRAEGVEVKVPPEAEQAVIFLAPVTGGDFATLRSAVQGRPGIFVRASQDLAAAGFEQARVEKYIASMKELTPEEAADPKQLQEHSNLIAATLALRPNTDCMKLPPDQQYTCLTQTGGQMLLDDGHGQTIVDALTGNTGAGLIGTASTTQLAGAGLYSAYVGTIVDLVHIMGSLHTAQYQYIPAIAFPQQQLLNLRLNTPPSFHNPKSVIVIGLPSVQATIPPPLRAADPSHVSCLQRPGVVLPVEGAPLVFSTSFAHDLVLHLNVPPGKPAPEQQNIPLTADAFRGGLVLATIPKRHALPNLPLIDSASGSNAPAAAPEAAAQTAAVSSAPDPATGAELTGTVEGFWGFEAFTGPTMPLEETPGKDWKLADADPLIAGQKQRVVITATGTACIQGIALDAEAGKPVKETWKAGDKPNSVEVTLEPPAHESGVLHLAIEQYGEPKPALISVVSYNQPAKIEALSFHAGDTAATITGTNLGQVRQVEFGGLTFKPAERGSESEPQAAGKSEMKLTLPKDAAAPALPVGDSLTAEVALNDGRKLRLALMVEPARPAVTLIGTADVPPDTAPRSQFHVRLTSQSDLPVSDALMFSLKSAKPFPRAGQIEIASPDDSLHAVLSVAKDTLILEDPQTLLATLQPLKDFGSSAFGPIRLRAVAPDGTTGEWLPLVTLVRLPTVTGLSCPVAEPPPMARQGKSAKGGTASRTTAAGPDAPPAAPAADDATAPVPDATASPDGSTSAGSTAAPPATAQTAPPAAQPTAAPPPQTAPAATCTLTGTGLYFIDTIATYEAFTNPTLHPERYVGSSLDVPPPVGAVYYLRLRDDPATVNTVTLPAGPL